jgi:hypothetical protein
MAATCLRVEGADTDLGRHGERVQARDEVGLVGHGTPANWTAHARPSNVINALSEVGL